MIDKKILIGIGIGLLISVLILAGISLNNRFTEVGEHKYEVGYQNATNITWTTIWKNIGQDGCILLPVPINNTLLQYKFCLEDK